MTLSLSSIVLSHFLLDLQDAHRRSIGGELSTDELSLSHTSSRCLCGHSHDVGGMFASLGATIDYADDDSDQDEEHTDGKVAAEAVISAMIRDL